MSGVKKPTLKGMKHTGHLGHFAQDKFIQQGHNDSGKVEIRTVPYGSPREAHNGNYVGTASDGTIVIGNSEAEVQAAIEAKKSASE